jgi:hypothetical protein
MVKRGHAFYYRIHKRSGERWVALGSNYAAACEQLRELKEGKLPVRKRVIVSQAVDS